MKPRVVEIGNDNRHLSLYRGFLSVNGEDGDCGRVAIADIATVVVCGHGITYTNDLLVALSNANVPVILCGQDYAPKGWLWPVDGNYQQAARMDAQAAATKPTKKRIWKAIVRAKVRFQADHLDLQQKHSAALRRLEAKVKRGDPDNIEARAARVYWKLLMGQGFTRGNSEDPRNAYLNYAYAVIRSAVARSVAAAGLHPTLALAHRNQYNPMRLVDDLMEPYRPLADHVCMRLLGCGETSLGAREKQAIAGLLSTPLDDSGSRTTFSKATEKTAQSLVKVYLGKAKKIWYPAHLFSETNATA